MTKSRKEKTDAFRKDINKARVHIRKFIIMMVGLYIGFHVMIHFLKLDVDLIVMAISIGIGVVIFGSLFYTAYQIKKGRQLLEGPNKENPEQTIIIKELKMEVNDLKKEIAWLKSIRDDK